MDLQKQKKFEVKVRASIIFSKEQKEFIVRNIENLSSDKVTAIDEFLTKEQHTLREIDERYEEAKQQRLRAALSTFRTALAKAKKIIYSMIEKKTTLREKSPEEILNNLNDV